MSLPVDIFVAILVIVVISIAVVNITIGEMVVIGIGVIRDIVITIGFVLSIAIIGRVVSNVVIVIVVIAIITTALSSEQARPSSLHPRRCDRRHLSLLLHPQQHHRPGCHGHRHCQRNRKLRCEGALRPAF